MSSKKDENKNSIIVIPDRFPVINLAPAIMVFPGTKVCFFPKERTIKLVQDFDDGKVGPYILAVMTIPEVDGVPKRFFSIGVIAELSSQGPEPESITLTGIYRTKFNRLVKKDEDSYFLAETELFQDQEEPCFIKDSVVPKYRSIVRAFLGEAKKIMNSILLKSENIGDSGALEMAEVFNNFDNHDFNCRDSIDYLVWQILSVLPEASAFEKQSILENRFLMVRLRDTIGLLLNNLKILINREQIQEMFSLEVTKKQGSRNSRNTGRKSRKSGPSAEKKDDPPDDDQLSADAHPEIIARWKRFQEIKDMLSPDALKAIVEDFERLKSNNPGQAEWNIFINHLDCLLDIYSAGVMAQEEDFSRVEETLGQSHYGLDNAKERIYNYLATKKLNPKGKAPILGFVGPPGVGKTSLAKSVAASLGLKFIRLSLGGVKDEADIRGHRLTYIGAIPGKIIQEIRRVGIKNPVIILDEVDKLSNDFRGDPSSALLEVLDPEQNHSFQDHYVGAPFDLSNVLFICTANLESGIQPALYDRMNIISIAGYTEQEKLEIAKRYLVSKQLTEVGLANKNIILRWQDNDPDKVIAAIISGYTREAGVRELERQIHKIFSGWGRQYLKEADNKKSTELFITEELVGKFLKTPPYLHERAEVTEVGEAIGLAWTPVGGDIIYVQAELFKKSGGEKPVSQTGKLQEIFREANKNALTVVKNLLESDEKAFDKFRTHSIHLSVPDGAIPKDGPSAGITMAVAIYSEITGKLVKPYVAMIGEITVKGRIRAVGGIKAKILAAHREGIKEVILPSRNKRDIDEKISEDIKKKLAFHFVTHILEVLPIVITDPA